MLEARTPARMVLDCAMQPAPDTQESTGKAAAENVSNWFDKAVTDLAPWLIWAGGLLIAVFIVVLIGWLLFGRRQDLTRLQLRVRGAILLPILILGVLLLLVTMPVSDTINNSLIGLFGLSIAALITLGSTTIFANFMAGVMMYHVRSFRPGDYIRVEEHSGRVTAKGLFHVEIQTEERDLITLPNAFLITNPVRVVRTSGTIITCELSLGYDVPHERVTQLLLSAIEAAGLADGFVQIRNLGDFSIAYRACGLLDDTKKLVSMRTTLRSKVLQSLHGAGVEIVSPDFINHRPAPDVVIPERVRERAERSNGSPEKVIFDKADDAERLEHVKQALTDAKATLKKLEADLAEATDDESGEEKARIKDEIERQNELIETLTSQIAKMEE